MIKVFVERVVRARQEKSVRKANLRLKASTTFGGLLSKGVLTLVPRAFDLADAP